MKKIVLIIFLFSTIYSECIGDLNSDNIINISDAILLINIILEDGLVDELSDLNLDGGANILDIILLVNLILDNGNSCEVIWGQETTVSPYFYYASDIDSSQINQITNYYNIAQEAWGNFGPLEFWVIGTDVLEASNLDQEYCELRLEKDPCLGNNFLQWCLNREYNFVAYANNGGAGLSLTRDNNGNCLGYSYLEITLSSKYPFPNESDYDVVTMHEYFHAYQQAHIDTYDYSERAELMVINPWWSEGGAEYMAQLLYSQQSGVESDYLKERMTWKMYSKNDLYEDELISEIPYGNRGNIAYDLGAWSIAYLISLVGLDTYRINFYNDLNDYGWEESFIRNFDMTAEQFLLNFHNFLDLSIEEQLTIIP
jgi:hypothetical protein|tara:strand:+ start:68 stop:1177 length:1110 start_codon:yes stop_codon:yes gene_type:complete